MTTQHDQVPVFNVANERRAVAHVNCVRAASYLSLERTRSGIITGTLDRSAGLQPWETHGRWCIVAAQDSVEFLPHEVDNTLEEAFKNAKLPVPTAPPVCEGQG